MQNRREFVKKTALGLTSIGISGTTLCSFSKTNDTRITILHTNDTHSQIEPLPKIIINTLDLVVLQRGQL